MTTERVAIVVKVELNINDDGVASVEVERLFDPELGDRPVPPAALLAAAEYITHLVAKNSGLGYEGALEKIAEGAMTYMRKGS